ncbi:hypothetical protein [Candidatus Uabimicrobium amorphum]|uniref:Uncharacterized protein n=1 Tax=Uabimicrobium amorphum TaxID=2596890 RepID=A0A5S9IKP3_UABAM|nr:hypothetical protein [Candidatus Uabimicrobium amorphum]BBM83639.1 hypothetical protein UABAM_01992 [Candidatus Uabimicrobium amorphum]
MKLRFSLLICMLSLFVFADIEQERYPIFAMGESKEIARNRAIARAEKLAKQAGKQYSVYNENYSKFTGGTFWKCRLDVSFHKIQPQKKQDRYPVMGRGYSQTLARSNAEARAQKIAKQTGKKYSIYGEKYTKLSGGRIWICRLDVSFHNLASLMVEDSELEVTTMAKEQHTAYKEAVSQLQMYQKDLDKKYNILCESYLKRDDKWQCKIKVSFTDTIEKKPLLLSFTFWGKSKKIAKQNVMQVIKSEIFESEYSVVSEVYTKVDNDLWEYTISFQLPKKNG